MRFNFLQTLLPALIFLAVSFGLSACNHVGGGSVEQRREQKLPTGNGSFEFDKWAGPALKTWTYVPKQMTPETPIVFVMHGVNRDGARYRDDWAGHAERGGFILVVPTFSKKQFPGAAGYNLGNIKTWKGGAPVPRAQWALSAIEPIFDRVKTMTGNVSTSYAMYGHSAGAQFVHRFVYFTPDARLSRAVAANAGWYAMPDFDIAYPYGLAGAGLSKANLRRALSAGLVVLLGAEDTDPSHRHLRRTEGANAQGPHRFARGQSFFNAGRDRAAQIKTTFGWTLQYAAGIGHKNKVMARFAAPLLAGIRTSK
jgi:hypothetical protein